MSKPPTIQVLLALVAAAGCGGGSTAHGAPDAATEAGACAPSDRATGKCESLVDYGLFVGPAASETAAEGVVAYGVNSSLFADFAVKHRFIYLPPGQRMTYDPVEPWTLPRGAIAIKTFGFLRDYRNPSGPERLIETRLLIVGDQGIVPITYAWNEEQSEAKRVIAGTTVAVSYIDADGAERTATYGVPNTNQCKRCHGGEPTKLLGVRTRQLERQVDAGGEAGIQNQIDLFAGLGLFDTTLPSGARQRLVEPDDRAQPVEDRARSYLEANCAHCHNPQAAAEWSGLYLNFDNADPARLGVCKSPSSAGDTGGHKYDVVPGSPEESVLLYRMKLVDSAYRMPEGARLPDPIGISVVGDWISAMMPGASCAAAP